MGFFIGWRWKRVAQTENKEAGDGATGAKSWWD